MNLIMRIILIFYNKIHFIKIKIRTIFWALLFNKMGNNSKVLGRIVVYNPKNVTVGKASTLNEGVLLNARAQIIIGDHVHISPYCTINTGGLDYKKIMQERNHKSHPVVIKDGAWLATGSIINPGVIIGENSVVASGAVVTRDVPPNTIVAGVPAVVIKNIS